jgi:hypothetical protein
MRSAIAMILLAGSLANAACQDSLVTRTIGARCDVSHECDDRCLPEGEGFPGGFCTYDCATQADCTVRSACVELQGGVCLYDCTSSFDCEFLGPGWTCAEIESREDPTRRVQVCVGS